MPRAKAQRSKPATPKPNTTDAHTFYGASITLDQVTNQWTTRARPDIELIARGMSGTPYAALNLIATVVAAQQLRLMRPTSGSKMYAAKAVTGRKVRYLRGDAKYQPGRKAMIAASAADDIEEVLDHPALDRIQNPTPYLTYQQWVWLIAFWQECTGRAYAWMGDTGEPILYPMGPHYVNVVGSKTNLIEKYRYGRDSTQPVDLAVEDVIYFRERQHPDNPIGAISWMHSIVKPSDMENAALAAEIKRWENGGFPGGLIETDITDRNQLKQARLDFEAAYRGVHQAGRTMLMSKGSKYVPNATKPHELAYKDGLELATARIWSAAGVPEPVWKMNESNRASAVQGDPAFMGYRILPILNGIADKLTADFLSRYPGTEGWWFVYDNPVAEDVAAVVTHGRSMIEVGAMTPNELRALQGMEPGGPELDVPRYMGQPLTMPTDPEEVEDDPAIDASGDGRPTPDSGGTETADEQGEEPGDDGAGAKAAKGTETPARVVSWGGTFDFGGKNDKGTAGGSGEGGEGFSKGTQGVPKESDGKHNRPLLVDGTDGSIGSAKESPVKVEAHTLTCACGRDHGKKSVSEAQGAFDRALRQWMDRAVAEAATPGVDAFSAENLAELNRLVETGLQGIFREGAQTAAADIGDDAFNLIDREAAAYARERAAEMVTGVTETLREQVRNVIADGFIEGDTLNELRDKLEASGIAQNRTEAIVRTETSLATQGASLRVYAAAGWEGKYWDTKGGPCPLCEAIGAQYGPDNVIPINQPFYNAGDSVVGTDGKVYTFVYPVMAGLAHPNCGCSAIEVEVMPEAEA